MFHDIVEQSVIFIFLLPIEGRWKVTTRTNALPSAGTQAQVTITVYGTKGNSGPVTLGHGDGGNFQPGQVDDFSVSIRVYKSEAIQYIYISL